MKNDTMNNCIYWNNAEGFYDHISEELLNCYNFYHYAYIGGNDDEFFDFIVKKSQIQNGSKVLDLGCGSGYLTNRLRNLCNPTGLTNSEVCLNVAKKDFQNVLLF
jgi:cyclopropane fatty-acyl-phospholipid synthase-like methyltransferase